MGLSEGQKSFHICLAVLIQYRRVTDTQPPSHPRCRSKDADYYVARVKMQKIGFACGRRSIHTSERHREAYSAAHTLSDHHTISDPSYCI